MTIWVVAWVPDGGDSWRRLYCGSKERAEAEVAKLKAAANLLQGWFAKEPKISEVEVLP